MIDGDPNPHTRRSVKAPKPSGDREELDALLNKLARWEESNPVYREMLAAAEARVADRGIL